MLSTLLTSLATNFSKGFLLASALPVAAFGFFNALTAYRLVEPFRDWVSVTLFDAPSAARSAFAITTLCLAVLAGGLVMASLNNYLRGLLEGRWPEAIRTRALGGQVRRLRRIDLDIQRAARIQTDLERDQQGWLDRLTKGREDGSKTTDNKFAGQDAPASQLIRKLHEQQEEGLLVDSSDIKKAVDALAVELNAHNVTIRNSKHQKALREAHEALVLIIQSTVEQAPHEHLRLSTLKASSFGAPDIAPTAMGNIAAAAQAYAVRRYNCNLELFWSNLQRVMQKDDTWYTALQDSKSRLDFLVACGWLTSAYWMIWLAVCAVWGYSLTGLYALAVIGPLASYFWYRVATEHYRSFTDLIASSLDFFRMDLLRALSIALPLDVADERRTWDHLHQLSSFDSLGPNLRYKHPAPPPP